MEKQTKKKKKLNLNIGALLDDLKKGRRGKKLGVSHGDKSSDSEEEQLDTTKRAPKIKKAAAAPAPTPKKKKKRHDDDPFASDSDSIFSGDGYDDDDLSEDDRTDENELFAPEHTTPPKTETKPSPKTASAAVTTATPQKKGVISRVVDSAKKALGYGSPATTPHKKSNKTAEKRDRKIRAKLDKQYKNTPSEQAAEELEGGGAAAAASPKDVKKK